MLHVLFRFLLVGWWPAEVETPNTVIRTTKVQAPSSLTPDMSHWSFVMRILRQIILLKHLSPKDDYKWEDSSHNEWPHSCWSCWSHCYEWRPWGTSWIFISPSVFSYWRSTSRQTVDLLICLWRPHFVGHRGSPVQPAEISCCTVWSGCRWIQTLTSYWLHGLLI